MRPLRDAGKSLRRIAAELTKQGIRTPRGGAWTGKQVSLTLARLAKLEATPVHVTGHVDTAAKQVAAVNSAEPVDRAPLSSR